MPATRVSILKTCLKLGRDYKVSCGTREPNLKLSCLPPPSQLTSERRLLP